MKIKSSTSKIPTSKTFPEIVFFQKPIICSPDHLIDVNDIKSWPGNWTSENVHEYNKKRKTYDSVHYEIGYSTKGLIPERYQQITRGRFISLRKSSNSTIRQIG